MHNKRKAMIAGVALLVSLSLLFAGIPIAKSWGGDSKPLLATVCYYWGCSGDITGQFSNTKSNGIGVVGYGTGTYGQGVQGAAPGTSAIGVIGFNRSYIGVAGYGDEYGTYGNASGSSGQGVRGYSSGSNGMGVLGYSPNYTGVSGYGDEYGTYGNAIGSSGQGVRGYSSGSTGKGVVGYAVGSSGYGGFFLSNLYRGLYADGATNYYDAYFPDIIRAGGSTLGSFGMALNALNDGSEALEPGDLVAFSGFVTSAEGSEPTLAVRKVSGANSQAIVGVVQSAYVEEKIPAEAMQMDQPQIPEAPADIEEAPIMVVEGEDLLVPLTMESQQEGPEVALQPEVKMSPDASRAYTEAGHFIEGAAQPGQYVVVVIQGITQVKVDASAAPVRAGDMLVASGAGYAINATTVSQPDEVSRPREGVDESGDQGSRPSSALAVGRALESLETGTGTIYVFVSVR